jgi:hypothetical protein
MKIIRKITDYARNNKLKFSILVLLDLLFIIILFMLTINYLPVINENINEFNEIISFIGTDNQESLGVLISHSDEIIQLQSEIVSLIRTYVLSVLLVANLIFGLFFSIYFKKLKSLFLLKFIGINIFLQTILWIIFSFIVNIKSFIMSAGILYQAGRESMFIFLLITYIIYFFGLVFFVEYRNKKIILALKNSIKILKTKGLILFGRYVAVIVLFWFILIISQMPVLMNIGTFTFFIFFIIGIFVFITYLTFSKLFLVELVISKENKRLNK